MESFVWGSVFALAAAVMAWLGVRRRRNAHKEYEDDVQRYSATAIMKIIHVEESTLETWRERDNGEQELCRETTYLPTYEYTVDGKTYQYSSRQSVSGKRDLGRQVVGYYDPANPNRITENKPRKPIFGGFGFFIWAVILLFFAIGLFTGNVAIS